MGVKCQSKMVYYQSFHRIDIIFFMIGNCKYTNEVESTSKTSTPPENKIKSAPAGSLGAIYSHKLLPPTTANIS